MKIKLSKITLFLLSQWHKNTKRLSHGFFIGVHIARLGTQKEKFMKYNSHAAIEAHKNTQHFKMLIANTENLITKPVVVELLKVVQ